MGVAAIKSKLREKRLGCSGHAVKGDKYHITRQATELVPEGTQIIGEF